MLVIRKKTCSQCGKEKLLTSDNFPFGRESAGCGLSAPCNKCRNSVKKHKYRKEYQDERREKVKVKVIEYLLEHPCVDCGEADPFFLDFDHKRDKVGSVGKMAGTGFSWEKVKEEIDKCEVRCKKCHLIKTAKEQGWYDKYYERVNKVKKPQTGFAPA